MEGDYNMNIAQESPVFNFRSKFRKVIANATPEEIIEVQGAFASFCGINNFKEVIETIWKITYISGIKPKEDTNEDYLEWKRSSLEELGVDLNIIPMDKVGVFVNELRYQYEQTHPGFFEIVVDKELVEPKLQTLIQQTNPVVARVVYDKCYSWVNSNKSIEKMVKSLEGQEEKAYMYAIKKLGFSNDEVEYLKQFRLLISNLVIAIDKWHQEVEEKVKQNEKKAQTASKRVEEPIIVLEEDNQGFQELETQKQASTDTEKEKTKYKKITFETIRDNKEMFEKAINGGNLTAIKGIMKLGLDLNEVFKKSAEIDIILVLQEDLYQ